MNLKEYKAKKMNDPEFVKAYEEIQPEMNVIRAIIDARISQNISQKELAERTGIAQTEISKLENGTRNPSIKLLQRLADGMDMVLNISFTPKADVRKRAFLKVGTKCLSPRKACSWCLVQCLSATRDDKTMNCIR